MLQPNPALQNWGAKYLLSANPSHKRPRLNTDVGHVTVSIDLKRMKCGYCWIQQPSANDQSAVSSVDRYTRNLRIFVGLPKGIYIYICFVLFYIVSIVVDSSVYKTKKFPRLTLG